MRTVAAGVLLLSALTACGGDTSPAPRDAGASSAPATMAAAPQTSPADLSAKWRTLHKRALGQPLQTVKVSASYRLDFADSTPGQATPQRTQVFENSGKQVFDHRAEVPAWHTQDAWLVGDRVLVEDLNLEARLIQLRLFELPSGREMTIPRAAKIAEPEVGVGDGFVTFATGSAKSRMCQQVVEVSTLQVLPEVCGARRELLGDGAVRRGGSTFSAVSGEGADRCKRLVVVRAGKAEDVPVTKPCGAWSSAVLGDATAWDEMDPASPMLEEADGFVQQAGGKVTALGKVSTDSLVACGERFFWTARPGGGNGRWIYSATSSGRVSTVWRGPDDNHFPTLLECTDDRWLTTNITGTDNDEAVVLDTATLE